MGRFVLMGVSGCGKSSVGEAVAKGGAVTFIDGDDLHPPANIEKMASGQPLNDEDRAPWLADVGRALAVQEAAVIGCSALKRIYRDWIRAEANGPVHFLHLVAPMAVLAERVAARPGHFMPPELLQSQFDALEPLGAGEWGTVIDIAQPFETVVAQAEIYIKETMT